MASEREETMPRRGLESECSSEDPSDKKKKTKDFQNDDGTENQTLSEHKKKKKKKSKEKKESTSINHADQGFHDGTSPKSDIGEPKKCDSKKSFVQEENFHETKDNYIENNSPDLDDGSKKKKKKKKKLRQDDSQASLVAEESIVSKVPEYKEKKKKKKRKRAEEDGEESNEESHGREEQEEGMKKKKKKIKDTDDHSQSSDQHEQEEEKNDTLSVSADSVVLSAKKKKKKDKCRTQQESSPDLKTSTEGENQINTGKHDECNSQMNKKKKKKDQENENVCNMEEEQNESSKKARKKKKKKEEDDEKNQVETEASQSESHKKSNLFKDAVFESSEREDQFSRVTGKPSKADNEGDEKVRKKNEVEPSSVSRPTDKNEPADPAVIKGQWQGGLFENEERQNKFLRLLGGMKSPNPGTGRKNLFSSGKSSQKKGLFGSLSASVPNLSSSSESGADMKGGNKALSVSQASDVNKRLEDDYNKAMNFRLSSARGAGLGFAPDPAEGKKFHIDANATKSIKFDDN